MRGGRSNAFLRAKLNMSVFKNEMFRILFFLKKNMFFGGEILFHPFMNSLFFQKQSPLFFRNSVRGVNYFEIAKNTVSKTKCPKNTNFQKKMKELFSKKLSEKKNAFFPKEYFSQKNKSL